MATVIKGVKFIGLFGMCTNSDAQKTLCIVSYYKYIYFVSKSNLHQIEQSSQTKRSSFDT